MEVIDGVGSNTNTNAVVCPPEASPPPRTMLASSLNLPRWPITSPPRRRSSALCWLASEGRDAQGIELPPLAESEAEYIETEPAEVLAVGSVWSYLKVGLL